jgi:multiple sugar transport system ATP-binding protein
MRTELQRLHKELDTTIIYVTHDQAEAMTMSDRIAVIDSGQLQQIDPPLTCYNEPANLFVAGFIGSPSMNFIEGEITEEGFVGENVQIDFEPADVGVERGQDVTLGVRPEDISLSKQNVNMASRQVEATTDVLEPMGNEIFVYLLLSEDAETDLSEGRTTGQLLMSVSSDTDIQEDEEVTVWLDRSKIHLFDTETGEALHHGLSTPASTTTSTGSEAESDD